MTRTGVIFAFLLSIPINLVAAEVHKKVQAALSYNIPMNECKQPKLAGAQTDIVDTSGTTTRSDIDSYKLARFERKEKRWKTCLSKYKQGLKKDFDRLRNSAQYGLTQQQAEIILEKMALIQSALISPVGLPEQ
jgi:hypothetical protein